MVWPGWLSTVAARTGSDVVRGRDGLVVAGAPGDDGRVVVVRGEEVLGALELAVAAPAGTAETMTAPTSAMPAAATMRRQLGTPADASLAISDSPVTRIRCESVHLSLPLHYR